MKKLLLCSCLLLFSNSFASDPNPDPNYTQSQVTVHNPFSDTLIVTYRDCGTDDYFRCPGPTKTISVTPQWMGSIPIDTTNTKFHKIYTVHLVIANKDYNVQCDDYKEFSRHYEKRTDLGFVIDDNNNVYCSEWISDYSIPPVQ